LGIFFLGGIHMLGRIIVCGDIHGSYKALLQCLERSNFDKENDTLIQLGDVVDGWSESYECVEELLTIKNLIAIKGNHDEWLNEFFQYGIHPDRWMNGGEATRLSYIKHCTHLTSKTVPQSHQDFFRKQLLYYTDDKNRCYVHGGFDRTYSISDQARTRPADLYWDRKLWDKALSVKSGKLYNKDKFDEIFIGHTSTGFWGKNVPMSSGGVTNMDTGAGWEGKLSFMDVDTREIWQSDKVSDLHSEEHGRRGYKK
jgi:serine/threonine protein phosphatase 1